MAESLSNEMLVGFLHGELDELAIRRVEAAMAGDPSLERRLEALAQQDDDIRSAFEPILALPVPDRLVASVNATNPEAEIVDIAAARARRTPWNWGWPQLGAVAASLAIGLVVGSQTGNTPAGETGALVVATADGPTLGGGLETLLAATKSGERKQLTSLGTASVTISFMTAEGKLCRQFAIEGKTRTTDGVACRAQRGWRVEALALRAGDTGEMRTASGDAAPAVISTVDALIAGDPLDAAAEAKALSVE